MQTDQMSSLKHKLNSKTELIDALCAGTWVNPLTGKLNPPVPFDQIVISESLKGYESSLVSELGFQGSIAVVCDEATFDALGERVASSLSKGSSVTEIILEDPHADMATIRMLKEQLQDIQYSVAVGTGTINDLTKYATHELGKRYCVFATAASMNGYTSSTASITLDSGLKVSLPAQNPMGFFVDLEVCSNAPAWLNAAGFGDCICRSVAQIDWWMSHRMMGTMFRHEPYIIEIPEEVLLLEQAEGIAKGEIEAIATLFRVLTLCGLGISFTGVSNHGSMGEHQISHYIDCFAGKRHPGSIHGTQVGITTLTMARLQQMLLHVENAPEIKPTNIDLAGMTERMGREVAKQCAELYKKKAFNSDGAKLFNKKIKKLWPQLREECLEMAVTPEKLSHYLSSAGGPTRASELGLPVKFYREAVSHAHEMRDRFSFADIASGTDKLEEFAEREY